MAGCGAGERKLTNKFQTEPGEAIAFALVLIMISASICVTCEGLQEGSWTFIWNGPLNVRKKKKGRKRLRSLWFRDRHLRGKGLTSAPSSPVSRDLKE